MHRENVPLNALRAFEAAGRKLSFAEAARELHVSPAAISHHIKSLEEFMGTPLFTRKYRAIELTDAGRQFLAPLSKSFLSIEETTMRIKNGHRDGPLRIRVAACIASKWLLPRLNLLQQKHPDLNLEVTVSSEIFEFRYSEMDALIRLRSGNFTAMDVEPFFSEQVAAVCSPDFLRRHGPIASPRRLIDLPLIHDDNLKTIPTFPDWQTWFREAGVDAPDTLPGHRFDSSSMVLDAALAGRGVALARSALATRELELGNLVRVCGFDYPVTHDYFIIFPASSAKIKQIRTLHKWLLSEAAGTYESWSSMPVQGETPEAAHVPLN